MQGLLASPARLPHHPRPLEMLHASLSVSLVLCMAHLGSSMCLAWTPVPILVAPLFDDSYSASHPSASPRNLERGRQTPTHELSVTLYLPVPSILSLCLPFLVWSVLLMPGPQPPSSRRRPQSRPTAHPGPALRGPGGGAAYRGLPAHSTPGAFTLALPSLPEVFAQNFIWGGVVLILRPSPKLLQALP